MQSESGLTGGDEGSWGGGWSTFTSAGASGAAAVVRHLHADMAAQRGGHREDWRRLEEAGLTFLFEAPVLLEAELHYYSYESMLCVISS